jgi:hypothetical protein
MRRLVEAELDLELLDEFGVEPLRAAVFRADRIEARGALGLPARAEIAAGGPGDARARAGVRAGPPGANCTTTNDTSMIPSRVGTMNRMRRRM